MLSRPAQHRELPCLFFAKLNQVYFEIDGVLELCKRGKRTDNQSVSAGAALGGCSTTRDIRFPQAPATTVSGCLHNSRLAARALAAHAVHS